MNIAITGSSGNLGSVLCRNMVEAGFNVYPIPSDFYRPKFQSERIGEFFLEKNISALIHCASLTNVDFSETNKKVARDSNVGITEKFSTLASSLDCKMVFISSTGVYGNNLFSHDNLNSESDKISPLSYYHTTKMQAELIVNSLCKEPLILRVGWLFGSASRSGKDFVLSRVQEMAKLSDSDEYYSNMEQFGNPTSSEFVSETISHLLHNDVFGVINCVNDGAVSRYEFVRRIKEICGFEFKLLPKPNSFFSRTALVPLNETGDTSKLASVSETSHWDQYLVKYCQKLKKESWRVL